MVKSKKHYKIKNNILWKKIDDEIVIIDSLEDNYSYLNRTGSEVWEMIDKGYAIDQIVVEIRKRYGNEHSEAINKDIHNLFKDLVGHGLLEKI
jgi:hypothetical protein